MRRLAARVLALMFAPLALLLVCLWIRSSGVADHIELHHIWIYDDLDPSLPSTTDKAVLWSDQGTLTFTLERRSDANRRHRLHGGRSSWRLRYEQAAIAQDPPPSGSDVIVASAGLKYDHFVDAGYSRLPIWAPTEPVEGWLFCVATWVPLVPVPFVVFVAAARAHKRRRRGNTNRCITCGYDLRESPQRCPECGGPGGLTPEQQLRQRRSQRVHDLVALALILLLGTAVWIVITWRPIDALRAKVAAIEMALERDDVNAFRAILSNQTLAALHSHFDDQAANAIIRGQMAEFQADHMDQLRMEHVYPGTVFRYRWRKGWVGVGARSQPELPVAVQTNGSTVTIYSRANAFDFIKEDGQWKLVLEKAVPPTGF